MGAVSECVLLGAKEFSDESVSVVKPLFKTKRFRVVRRRGENVAQMSLSLMF